MPERGRRLVAAAVALLLVVAAVIWRASRDHGSSATTTTVAAPAVICASELAAVCSEVFTTGVTIEPAGVTAKKLTEATTPPDLWLTLDPWPGTVAARRTDPLDVKTEPVASTQVGLAGRTERLSVLRARCGSQKLWACIGEVSGMQWSSIGGQTAWQTVRPGYLRPDETATGYATFANAVVAELGKTTFSTADLDRIQSWGRRLQSDLRPIGANEQSPFDQLQVGVLRYDLVGVLEAQVPATLKSDLTVLYPEPVANVAVIAMTRPGFALPNTLTSALTRHGWNPPVPTSGLPDADLTDAVLKFWKDVGG